MEHWTAALNKFYNQVVRPLNSIQHFEYKQQRKQNLKDSTFYIQSLYMDKDHMIPCSMKDKNSSSVGKLSTVSVLRLCLAEGCRLPRGLN